MFGANMPGRGEPEQAVPVAAVVEIHHAAALKAGRRGTLGVQLHQLHTVAGDVGEEADVVRAGHVVPDGEIIFVLDQLQRGLVRRARRPGLLGQERDAVAADGCLPGAVDDIAAGRADVEARPEHIGGDVGVGDGLPRQQFGHGDAKRPGDGRE